MITLPMSRAEALAECAFDLAEAGDLIVARGLAERALALDPRCPNAAHALAHVLYEERDWTGGADFLSGWLDGYAVDAPEHSHLSCHLAQFELWAGRPQQALNVYQERLDPEWVDAEHVRLRDAAAILWRLQVAELSGDLPWEALRPLTVAHIENPEDGLDAVHAAMVLAATCDAVGMQRLVHGLRRLAEHGHPTAGGLVLHLVRGIDAYAQSRFDEVIRELQPVMDDLKELGGSNAQRTIFDEMLRRSSVSSGVRNSEGARDLRCRRRAYVARATTSTMIMAA